MVLVRTSRKTNRALQHHEKGEETLNICRCIWTWGRPLQTILTHFPLVKRVPLDMWLSRKPDAHDLVRCVHGVSAASLTGLPEKIRKIATHKKPWLFSSNLLRNYVFSAKFSRKYHRMANRNFRSSYHDLRLFSRLFAPTRDSLAP